MKKLKVANESKVNIVATAITKTAVEEKEIAVRAIGAGAVNQAVKAIATATKFLEEDGFKVNCLPKFTVLKTQRGERTAITFEIKIS